MKLGMNVSSIAPAGTNRAFSNLTAASGIVLRTYNSSGTMPADRLDADGNVVLLKAGEYASRVVSAPTKAYRGTSVDIICRWTGTGEASAWGGVVKNVKVSGKTLTFTFVPDGFKGGNVQFTKIDPTNPVKNIDCRETDASPTAVFDPTFVAMVARYNTIRFMKWQLAVESNKSVTWATRTKVGDADYTGPDGIAIEHLVALANQAKTNPWFCIPWNADEEYIRKFATYVRDNLDPSLVAYVETSNEVWNSAYKVTAQAIAEGVAEGLHPSDKYIAGTKRYAEKTGQVMDIWSAVFAGKMNRIVRVAAAQNGTYSVGVILGFRDTAKKIDAIATAPYFGLKLNPGDVTDMDKWFAGALTPKLDLVLNIAGQAKAVAAKYNLRYITYEAGQHVTAPLDVPMLTAINRSPLMGKAYTRYLTKWQSEIGDLMVLFADYGLVSRYGAWGLQEYVGQPLSEAPKAQAADLFQRTYVTK
jgi:hypothetical protein